MSRVLALLLILIISLSGCSGAGAFKPEPEKQASPEPLPAPKGEITISLLDEVEFISLGAKKFMEKYPGTNIIINNFRTTELIETESGAVTSLAPSEEFSTENYLKQLNTKIMSNSAEDILLTDMIPVKKYTGMNVLEDLEPYIKRTKEINNDNYFMNIINLKKQGDTQYEMPLTVFFDVIFFDKKLIEASNIDFSGIGDRCTYEEAIKKGIQLIESTDLPNTYLSITDSSQIAYGLVLDNIDEFVKEDGSIHFDSSKFKEIIDYALDIDRKGYIDKGTIDFYNMEYYFAFGEDFPDQAALFQLSEDSGRGPSVLRADKNNQIMGRTSYNMAINKQSKNKDLAWAFINYLLSDEIQGDPSFYRTSINKNVFEKSAENYLKISMAEDIDPEEYTKLLWSWYEKIDFMAPRDAQLEEILYTELNSFYKNEIDYNTLVSNLSKSVDRYLNE